MKKEHRVKINKTFKKGFEISEYIIQASRKLLRNVSHTEQCLQYYKDQSLVQDSLDETEVFKSVKKVS